MATRSAIAKLGKDGIIKSVYCHSDGYLEHVGRVLDGHYRDESKVDELLEHGDISSLNKNIGVKIDFMDYETRTKNEQCRFYHRDRGEDLMFNEFESDIEYIEWAKESCNAEYIYMFAFGSWYVYDDNVGQFVELEDEIAVIGIR